MSLQHLPVDVPSIIRIERFGGAKKKRENRKVFGWARKSKSPQALGGHPTKSGIPAKTIFAPSLWSTAGRVKANARCEQGYGVSARRTATTAGCCPVRLQKPRMREHRATCIRGCGGPTRSAAISPSLINFFSPPSSNCGVSERVAPPWLLTDWTA